MSSVELVKLVKEKLGVKSYHELWKIIVQRGLWVTPETLLTMERAPRKLLYGDLLWTLLDLSGLTEKEFIRILRQPYAGSPKKKAAAKKRRAAE